MDARDALVAAGIDPARLAVEKWLNTQSRMGDGVFLLVAVAQNEATAKELMERRKAERPFAQVLASSSWPNDVRHLEQFCEFTQRPTGWQLVLPHVTDDFICASRDRLVKRVGVRGWGVRMMMAWLVRAQQRKAREKKSALRLITKEGPQHERYAPGSLANLRRAGNAPRSFRLTAGRSRYSYRLTDLAAFVERGQSAADRSDGRTQW